MTVEEIRLGTESRGTGNYALNLKSDLLLNHENHGCIYL